MLIVKPILHVDAEKKRNKTQQRHFSCFLCDTAENADHKKQEMFPS